MTRTPVPKDYEKHILSNQRWLRFSNGFSFGFSLLSTTLWAIGVFGIYNLFVAWLSTLFVYYINYRRQGHINNWWWLRRGKIVYISSYLDSEAANNWLKAQNYRYQIIFPGSFKIFNTPDAVHFKLVWG